MYQQKHAFFKHLKLIRENSNGNFLTFLEVILRDPAMIVYLNNEKSLQGIQMKILRESFLNYLV